MRIFNLLYLLLLLLAAVAAPVSSARPDFLHLKRKHRHYCLLRRCLPLHSRVPFP